MSTSTFPIIQNELKLYLYPIFMALGNIGNIFIVIFFSQQRQNACAIYLITSAIADSLYLTFNFLAQIFSVNYQHETIGAFAFCKINAYIPSVVGQINVTMVVLACIDRFMFTSDRATVRAFSTPKRAKYLIFFSIIFWSLFHIHIPIMTTIINGQCSQIGTYSTFFSLYIIIIVGLIPSILLVIFGCLTNHNMRQMYTRVQPVAPNAINGNNSTQRRDRALIVIVISEVLFYVVTTTLFPLILLERMISRYIISNKSIQYLQTEIFILNVALLLLFINSASSFYVYLTVSKPFRRHFKKLIMNIYQKSRGRPIVPIGTRITHNTITQQDSRV